MKNFAIIALFLTILGQYYIFQQEHESVTVLIWYNETLRLDWEAERRSIYKLMSILTQEQINEFYTDNRADLVRNNKYTDILIQLHPEILKPAK